MKPNHRWVYAGAIVAGCAAVVGYMVFSPTIYEFPSCVPGSKVVHVMHVPYGYQASTPRTLIRDDQLIGWHEKNPKGSKGSLGFYRNEGMRSTIMYATYPNYQPLGFTSWHEYSRMERESRDPKKLLFATVEFERALVLHPENSSFVHDENAKRKNEIERIREDSVDGQYWVYPPYDQRIRKSTGRPTYFLPKDTGFHVRIGCMDIGINAIPKDGQCFIRSDFGDDPHFACRSVEYRIAAKDMPNWRDFDARVKQQIKSLISVRTHGYDEALNRKEK